MTGSRTREWGELEREVMRLLWADQGAVSARQLQELFGEPVPAYTTLMTALNRLERKGLVVREEDSPRKVRFRASRSDGAHTSESMIAALRQAGDRRAALLAFAGDLDEDDTTLLRSAFQHPRPRR